MNDDARNSDALDVRRFAVNIVWRPSEEEIRAVDDTPWTGIAGKIFRPMSYEVILSNVVAGFVLYILGGIAIEAMAATVGGLSDTQQWLVSAVAAATVLTGLVWGVMAIAATPMQLRRIFEWGGPIAVIGAAALMTLAIGATSTRTDVATVLYAEVSPFAVYYFRRTVALVGVALCPALYAGLLAYQHTPDAFARWLMVTVVVVGLGFVVGTITARAHRLTTSERRAKQELAEFNRELETRVTEQVAEIGHLAELRRFLPPSVADAVASEDRDKLLAPHRRKIAIFFCDLRGFTAFTNAAEPEDVLGVVNEYFEVLGSVLGRHKATIAQYTGDGLMAFFGDPVETADPAGQAVAAAAQLRTELVPVVEGWHRHGFDLGHGVGISYGHATIGVVGTEGRYDYTPMGSVVNLAARICAQAKADQILLDHAAHVATNDRLASIPAGTFELKGFGPDVPAYELV